MVLLSLEQSFYTVLEEDMGIEICAVLFGDINKTVTANVSTSDGSAKGRPLPLLKINI